MTDHATPEQPAVTGEPTCPTCSKPLEEVRYRGGYLNRDQWESVRAGDWWCETCPSNGRGRSGAYYWSREVLSTLDPVSRTLGATDSPREDSTDVDRAWYIVEHSAIYDPPVVQRAIDRLRAQLSSTRTALQRVREAMPHDFFTHKANWRDALDKLMCMTQDADEKAYWRHELAAFDNAYEELAALTSSETDQ